MPDSITSAASAVNAAMKAAVKEINNQIKQLEAKRKAILAALGEPATDATQASKGKTTKASKNGVKGPGMLNVLLPFMEGKPQVSSSELLAQLQKHEYYKNATAGVIAAALSTELKKGAKSRVERVSKGNYRVGAAYFERTPNQEQPQQAEPQPEPTAA